VKKRDIPKEARELLAWWGQWVLDGGGGDAPALQVVRDLRGGVQIYVTRNGVTYEAVRVTEKTWRRDPLESLTNALRRSRRACSG
jgi:hypothetical protein